MSLYYLADKKRRAELNGKSLDDTSAYIPAILRFLGVSGKETDIDRLNELKETDVLIASGCKLPELLCTVISFAENINAYDIPEQKVYGYVSCGGKDAAVFVPFLKPAIENGVVKAFARTVEGEAVPALVKHGKKYEFTFDLPGSVWRSGDGFPAPGGKGGFTIGRVPDMRPLPVEEDSSVAYNDELCELVKRILLENGVPLFHTLPPLSKKNVPDMAVHVSGDDDATSSNMNLTAACNMEMFGIPYHVNAMVVPGDPTSFVMDRDRYEELKSHGCEVGLHINFNDVPYTLEGQKQHIDLFEKIFGERAYTNSNHCFYCNGSTAERLSWLEACGVKGDNCKLGEVDPNDANVYNVMGFGFGTSFPRYTCTDASEGNRIVETLEIPINYYEPRLDKDIFNDENKIERYIDSGAAYGRVVQFFIHPHYLSPTYAKITSTFNALNKIKSHIAEKGYKVWYTTTNNITDYWHKRSASEITECKNGEFAVNALCPLCLVLPDGAESAYINGEKTVIHEKTVNGKALKLISLLEKGKYDIKVEYSL